MCALLAFAFAGCSDSSNAKPAEKEFEIIPVNITQLKEMLDNKDTFVLEVERENCPFCNAMKDYLDSTKDEHKGLTLYQLDSTDYQLMRMQEGDMTLVSQNDSGKAFLELFPYFLYTPTLYQIKDGVPVNAGIGYDEVNATVSEWGVDSSIDWAAAKPVNVWSFIKDGQGTVSTDLSTNDGADANAAQSEQKPAEGENASQAADQTDSQISQLADEQGDAQNEVQDDSQEQEIMDPAADESAAD